VNLPLFYYRKHGSNLTSSEDLILSTRTQIIKGQFERRCTPINVLAVIPIRGPVADSNSPVFRKIGDRPLIDWTVDAALRAKRLTKVAVTSPDPDVLRFVRSTWPAQVLAIERDHTLALTNTSLNDTILHTIDMVERQDSSDANCYFDAVMQLAIESPFRTGQNIDSAIEVMELFDADAVVGVRPESDIFYRHNGGGLVPIRENVGLRLEREDIYRDAGSVRLCKRSSMIRYEPTRFIRVGHVVLNSKEALAVRNDWDFDLADYIANWKPNSIQN
jgi:CMP-N-acetylneuraminic acid synthetase